MADYNVALGVKPIEMDLGKTLKTAADIQSSQAYTTNTLAEAERKTYDQSREEIGRAAKHLLMMPEGPEREKLYQGYVNDFTKRGFVKPHEAEYFSKMKPSNMMLQQLVANSVPVATHSQITGETAGNEAATRSPYQTQEVAPTSSVVRPAQLPGAPSSVPTMGGKPLPTPVAPINAQGVPAPKGVGRPTSSIEADNERRNDPVYQAVPRIEPVKKPELEPGVARQGKDPAQLLADDAAVKFYDEKIRVPASQASEQRANYSTLRTALENGINTSKAGPALETVSSWMYAAGMDPKAIKEWTGTDPTSADILKKATVQESMKFVRDTIGARESLMAIQAITSAFPHLANTAEGNRMMVDIMDQLSQYKQDMGKYAGAFFEKNNDSGMSDRLNGFARWWSESHPAEQYVSRAMPRNPPRYADGGINTRDLQPGVTYMIPTGKEPDGKPIWGRATWDAKAAIFKPVR